MPMISSLVVNQRINSLRSFAILAVMLYHAGGPLSDGGWLGVDLFFVLSGFLITTLLLREVDDTGQFSLHRFWARRFLRLMPIYMLYVAGITMAILCTQATTVGGSAGYSTSHLIIAMWTYTLNFLPIGGIWEHQPITVHLWTLAVEEQFYFAWPLLLMLLVRSRHLVAASWALVLGNVAWNNLAYDDFVPVVMLHTRGIGLLIGCALAATLQHHAAWLRRSRLVSAGAARVLAGLCLASFGWITWASGMQSAAWHPAGNMLGAIVPLFDLVAGLLIVNLWVRPDCHSMRWLDLRPLPQIGRVSYGMYLYHMLILVFVWNVLLVDIQHWHSVPKFGLRLSVYIGLTLLTAAASYRYLELPFLRLKERLRSRPAVEPTVVQPTANALAVATLSADH